MGQRPVAPGNLRLWREPQYGDHHSEEKIYRFIATLCLFPSATTGPVWTLMLCVSAVHAFSQTQ
jgi:hypothetical protein